MMRLAAPVLLATSVLCRADGDLAAQLVKQVMRCWSPPLKEATRPEQLVVQYGVALNLDGSIAQRPQLSANPLVAAGDPVARAAADAALRAIWACTPYKMPPNRYAQWREIVLSFDARRLLTK